MATAIELYRRAYDLDYRKGDWQQAEQIYKEIVEKFPYSDEKEYALVHIERLEHLKANPHDQRLLPVRGSGGTVSGFSVLNFFLILVIGAAVALGGYTLWLQYNSQNYLTAILQGMLNERAGNFTQAGTCYREAQEIIPGRPFAYRCLAELYLSRKQFQLAEIESKKWQVADPADKGVSEFRMRLKSAVESDGESAQ